MALRIEADRRTQNFQFPMKLKWAVTFELTTVSAIIFIHCMDICVYFSHSPFKKSMVISEKIVDHLGPQIGGMCRPFGNIHK